MTSPTITQVLLSLVLVAISIAVARWWRIPVAKDMALGSVRTFVQLIAVGYALELIFDLESLWLFALAIIIIIKVGAHADSIRIKQSVVDFQITFAAIIVG